MFQLGCEQLKTPTENKSSVSSLVLVSIEKRYQALKPLFGHISKYLEVYQNTLLRVVFPTLFLVVGNVVKDGLLCLIY